MGDHRYELVYGTIHCVGRTEYHHGYADCEAAARRWLQGKPMRLGIPETDPVRWCPVHHCHMKRQQPWKGYRLATGDLIVEPKNEKAIQTKNGIERAT